MAKGVFGSSGRHSTRYPVENVEVFKWKPKDLDNPIKKYRQGEGASLGQGTKSPRALGAALAAAGGELPASMWKAARKGRLTRKV